MQYLRRMLQDALKENESRQERGEESKKERRVQVLFTKCWISCVDLLETIAGSRSVKERFDT